MVAGFMIILGGVGAGVYFSRNGAISAQTGTNLQTSSNKTNKRGACITDLRNLSENYAGKVQDAVLYRLAVLDGYDPSTGRRIPLVPSVSGKMLPDPDIQKVLAYKYVHDGLAATAKRKKVALLLTQPTLNRICGKPVVDKNESN